MGFKFVKGYYGPYSSEVNTAVTVLSNANLINEVQLGRMIETRVSPEFELNCNDYTVDELVLVNQTIDLLSRVKNTEQAEIMMTVMFAADSLQNSGILPTEEDILRYVFEWKKRWIGTKDKEIISTVRNLSELGWISPQRAKGVVSVDEDLF